MSEDEKLLKEAKKWPWEDRLFHKNWKVRNDGNIDLAAACDAITDPKDPRLREFGSFFKKTVADSNAPVQEKALDALIAYLRAVDADAGRYSKEICDAIVAKCLTGRPKTIEKAQNVFLLWVELEASEVFLEVMEKAIKNKVAKAVVPAIDVMFQAVSEFGTKIVPPKKILKMLSELFDHQDQNVRASAKGLTIELCRWIGKDPVKSILFEKMRDTMKKELEAELANVVVAPKPTRKIRSEQLKELEQEVVEAVECPRPVDEATASGPQEIDEYDLVDPVDILTSLEKSGFWEGVKAAKWSERRDAVAELTKLASVKKIAPGDFTEVCRTLKKLITDVNLAVGVEAVQATGNLAKGLRKDFGGGSRLLLPILLDKLKEKKAVMSDALTQTLQAMHKAGCLSLIDVIEDVKLASKNKVPSVRSLTLNWVTFCIESSNKAVVLKLHKDYVPICMECLNDGTPDVRDASFSALAAIAKLVGMKPLERSLEKLDDVRRNKLIEMIAASGNAQVPSLPSGTSRAIPGGCGSSPSEADENGFVKRSAASMLSGKKLASPNTQSAKKSTGKKADETKQSKAAAAIEAVEDIEPGEMSLEEIEGRVGSIFQEEVLPNLKSTIWKERLEAMNSLKETVESLSDLDQRAEILVRLVCVLPGWGDKNVQVQQKVLEVITHIVSTVSRFPKRCVVLCILGVAERVADIKTRIQAMQCLTAFCEAVGPNFIFDRLYKIMKEHKNPKVLSEGVTWMAAAVEDFGVSHIKLKDLIEFCKDIGLQSSAAATRTSTTKLIGILHKFVGPDIKGFLSDVKPALQTAIDAEFEKNPYEGPAATPKKTIKGLDSSLVSCGSGADGLPREDISGKISPTLIKNLSSPDWKVRLESIEAVNKILEEANNRIQPNGTGELFGALRARLFDSNKNLVMNTLIALGNIASAMGPAVEKSSKGIISDVLKCLSDNKKLMRESVIKALDLWVAAVQLDKMVPYIASALGDVKLGADGRKDLFDWLSRQLTKVNDQPDFVQLLKPTASALQDKSVDVRKAAEASLAEVTRVCGQEMIAKAMKELQGPALTAVLERQRTGVLQEFSEPSKAIVTTPGARSGGKSAKPIANGGGERSSSRSSHKATASRTFPTKASKQAVALAAQDYAVQGQALFNLKDSNKEDRERSISRKYKFEEPRLEQIQELENDLVKHLREDLHRRLLSSDFKKHVDGLDLLQKAIHSHIKEMIEIVDILLRWTVFRFCESNTTCLLKVLEFLPEFVDALKKEGYTLTEYEANILLPCLMEKSGHNIEKVREKMRELTKLIAGIYPPPKLFAYILEGLRSKNNRSRIECVDHIGYMIDHYGVEIASPSKALQIVAGLTSERDGELRKAALNTLAIAYKILGDDIWRFVGRLADAQKSMLDDKFKWKAREMEKRKEGKPGEARAALRRSVRDIGLETAEQSDDFIPRPISAPVLPSIRTSYGHFEALADQQLANGPAIGPSNWKAAIDVIDCGSPDQAVEGMKFVCYELSQANNNSSSTVMDDLVNDADQLVSYLTTKVAKTFSLVLVGASSRSCKYVLNTLMQTFQIKKVAHGVKEETLYNLITELLLWLLDERVQLVDDGSQLLKALNVLMLKILENADRTSAFVVLIRLLRPLDPSKWPSQVSRDADAIRSHKFSDLIVKCLIKLTKVLQSTIFEVDLDRLLESIHQYLQELGMEEIRKRAGADDKPLRMVKTVLHELVKLRGTAIKGHLSMVPIDIEPQPIILAYIELNLQTLAAARMLNPAGAVGQSNWGDSAQNGPTSAAPHSADGQLKQELAAIFKKIGDKQTCSIGLYELYRITQMHPQVDIFSQLQNASEAFRTYIRDGLAQMEKNSAAGRTPSSVPISTPPPVSSPTYNSLQLAPPSPLNDRLQMVPNLLAYRQEPVDGNGIGNFHAGAYDQYDTRKLSQIRYLASQYESNNFTEGENKSGNSAPRGTLDAIRERMKSIQAAAAGNPVTGSPNSYSNGLLQPAISQFSIPEVNDSSSPEALPESGEAPPKDEKALSVLQARMERLKSGVI
ncbi:protein MOR1-like isoform X1 [Cryptomeria japonica]|uniref:protein MOR1-like isoform X1 n=1 Tax=Cryptomeria japonica TaxID=3369 RepID=UPI0027DA16D2|nr:protein MOR1-like isoform X1 [Cryptomeria japonica]